MTSIAVAVVGDSGAGKTQLVAQLVPVLSRTGLSVGYIKHAPHGFEMDRSGSDSDRVRDAGAVDVVLTDDREAVRLIGNGGAAPSVSSLAMRMEASDVVLLEGFSSSAWPKIRVRAEGTPPREVAPPVLLDLERAGSTWDGPAVRRAADTILEWVADRVEPQVSVTADGVDVPVEGFAARVVASTVLGVAGPLRGVDDPAVLTVRIRRAGRGRP